MGSARQLGQDIGTRYFDPSVALDPNSLLREVVEAKVVLNGKPHHNLLKTGLTYQLMRYNHEHVSIDSRVRASIMDFWRQNERTLQRVWPFRTTFVFTTNLKNEFGSSATLGSEDIFRPKCRAGKKPIGKVRFRSFIDLQA